VFNPGEEKITGSVLTLEPDSGLVKAGGRTPRETPAYVAVSRDLTRYLHGALALRYAKAVVESYPSSSLEGFNLHLHVIGTRCRGCVEG